MTGYPPSDLILRSDFLENIEIYKNKIVEITINKKTIFSLSIPHKKKKIFNSLFLIKSGKIIKEFAKSKLPNYGVFDEKRYFSVKKKYSDNILILKRKRIKFLICEDMWRENKAFKNENIDLIISINASPYEIGKDRIRKWVAKKNAVISNSKLIYLNSVGSQDDLIFDGGSFLMDKIGNIISQEKFFSESNQIINTKSPKISKIQIDQNKILFDALSLSLKNYANKNNFKSFIVGLSGGVDSALCLAIMAKTFGPKNIKPYYLPTIFSSKESEKDATNLTRNFGIKLRKLNIEDLRKSIISSLNPHFNNLPNDVTEENLQSRLRGLLLMAISNKTNALLIATGNKSEYSVGYSTLYGDMCGGFALLKDLYKTKVYDLCNWINNKNENSKGKNMIPHNIINKEPTAELKFNQKDSDSLPPYEILDQILEMLIDENKDLQSIINKGFKKGLVVKVWKMIKNSEFKRYQSAIGPKLTKMSLANDRRFPITNKFEIL